MARVTHRHDDPTNQPLAEQVQQRLRALCEFEEWPMANHRSPDGAMIFRPWEKDDPAVHAQTAVLTAHLEQGDNRIAILLLSIRGTIPRLVIDRYLNGITADCARCGVNLTLEGPCATNPVADFEGTTAVVGAGLGEGPREASGSLGTPQTRPELWERVSLTIALTGHSLNADCLYETLVLLESAHREVLQYCRRAGKR